MAEAVKMPKMSDTMTEGVLAKWHKKVGDKIKAGDVIAEIETDKATMDFESFQEGVLLYVGVEEGKAVPVNGIIAVMGQEGEDYKAALEGEKTEEEPKAEEEQKTEENKTEEPVETTEEKEEPKQEEIPKEKVDTSSIPASVIRMPALSDTMTEGVINKWNFKVGDKIKSDDSLADVETDKATMEVVGYEEGTLLYLSVKEGEAVPVNGIIAIVGKEGTDISPLLNDAPSAEKKEEKKEETPAAAATPDAVAAPRKEEQKEESVAANKESSSNEDSRVKASPLAKKLAEDKGINLNDVKGSAEGGRIVKKDIEEYKPAEKPAEAPKSAESAPAEKAAAPAPVIPQYIGEEKFTEKPVSQMRKAISRSLTESLFTAPHFYLNITVDMDGAMAARTQINTVAPVKISFNDIVIKAVAIALKQHPAVNSSFRGDKIRFNEHTNIGVAMAIEDGLLVPVIRFADGKSLSHISMEVKDFAQKAKAKKLQPKDWEGSTFTVSNLGMFGIDEFTSIINTPDGAILSVGAIQQVPVVKNGAVVPGNIMKLSLGCDHRVIDGATGAQFLQTLKALLEQPIRLLA
ncbi:pyruvate dehydrogenase [Pedobacter psychrophilus]|uniref:Dihydrolipoamide acetyltransferase component of pyruvate dehydrogenase complex n=1 Tax=Pedobacter psychrophilus TaxID=1826909 RepID=A0A179DDN1_9SPHI|nr:dihydrolipoamide acetyltransferase family protein [Pedobacter psychrophilus]OAQ39155.1 pyruvate dehydrogenase [Pedobacter psychrophilus]